MACSVMKCIVVLAVLVHHTRAYVINVDTNEPDNKIVKQRYKYDEVDVQNDPRFIGSLIDSYMRFAQRFDASNPLKKIQKLGINRFLTSNVATVNRAFSSAWYRAKTYYYSIYSGLSSLMSALPENTRERIFENIVYNGVPYVMNATGWFDTSAVDWAVDTGSKVLEAYKKERQAERRHASGASSTEGPRDIFSGDAPRKFYYRKKRSYDPIKEAIESYFEQKFSPTQDQTSYDYYYDDETDGDNGAYTPAPSPGAQQKIIASPDYRERLRQISAQIRTKKRNKDKSANKRKSTTKKSAARQGETDDGVDRLSEVFDPYTILAGMAFATYLGVLIYLAAVPPSKAPIDPYRTRTLPMALKEPEGLRVPPNFQEQPFVQRPVSGLKAQSPASNKGQMVIVGKLVDWNSLQQGGGHEGAVLLPIGAGRRKARRTRTGLRSTKTGDLGSDDFKYQLA